MNLRRNARKCIQTCMGVKEGENVLIIADMDSIDIGQALRLATEELGAEASLVLLDGYDHRAQHPVRRVPKAILGAIAKSDVILTPFKKVDAEFMFRHELVAEARRYARIGHMVNVNERMFTDGGLTADYGEIKKLADLLAEILSKADEAEIITKKNAQPIKLTLSLGGWGTLAASDSGMFHEKGAFGNLPAGEAYIAPIPYTAEGSVCVDLSMDRVGTLVSPLYLTVVGGKVTRIEGEKSEDLESILQAADREAKERQLDPESNWCIAELGIGVNPKSQIVGIGIEDEKTKGTIHIALGDNSFFAGLIKAVDHIDGVIRAPTLIIDGKTILSEGRMTDARTLRALFMEDYETLDISDVASDAHVRRVPELTKVKRDARTGAEFLYKAWQDPEAHSFDTQVGNDRSAKLAARTWGQIPPDAPISVNELALKLGLDTTQVRKIAKLMETYRVIDVERKELFELMEELRQNIRQDLSGISSLIIERQIHAADEHDEQTNFLLKGISSDIQNLNTEIVACNVNQATELMSVVLGRLERLDTAKIRGTLGVSSIPPFLKTELSITKEIGAGELVEKLRTWLSGLKNRILNRK